MVVKSEKEYIMANSEVLGELEEMVLRDIKAFHLQNNGKNIEFYDEYEEYVKVYWENIIGSFGGTKRILIE